MGRRRRGSWEYSITIEPARGRVVAERLDLSGNTLYYSVGDVGSADQPVLEVRYYRGKQGRQPHLKLDRSRAALCQLPSDEKVTPPHATVAREIANELANMQRLDPSPCAASGLLPSGIR